MPKPLLENVVLKGEDYICMFSLNNLFKLKYIINKYKNTIEPDLYEKVINLINLKTKRISKNIEINNKKHNMRVILANYKKVKK